MATTFKEQLKLREIRPRTYTISHHPDWCVGQVYQGGCVAAAIQHVAQTHFTTAPKVLPLDQRDVYTLHLDFLRVCEATDSTIAIEYLKLGPLNSSIQLKLFQKGKLRVHATATMTNFDKAKAIIGELTAAPGASFGPHPALPPKPDFNRILLQQPDENWIASQVKTELVPMAGRMLVVVPKSGYDTPGLTDLWYGFGNEVYAGEKSKGMDATYLAFMTDMTPSMSDTLLCNNALYDARRNWQGIVDSIDPNHPGKHGLLVNTLAEAVKSQTFNNSITYDIEFKRRVPEEGLRWAHVRAYAQVLEDGRQDMDVAVYDEEGKVLCLSRQTIMVLDARRKFARDALMQAAAGAGAGGAAEKKKKRTSKL